MESYEQKYKAALEWMREMYPCLTDSLQEDAVHYFPELTESEDEKIRKAIIHHILYETKLDAATEHSWVAYLEKHKEQKQSEMEKEYVRTLHSLISDFLRGKQEIDREYYQKIWDWLDNRHIEQKPAEWSEDDEIIRDSIIDYINSGNIYATSKVNMITWLKYLRPQSHWKPSEAQMKVLKNVAYGYYQNGDGPVLRELYDNLKKL